VPTSAPVLVSLLELMSLLASAMPKSATFTTPRWLIMMLPA
jgi:hypothetical protein